MITKIKQWLIRILPPKVIDFLRNIRASFRIRYLRQTRIKVTEAQILNDLKKLGIKRGDIIFVHSSLKSIGFVESGPETVINALMEIIGSEGTLVMPCFSLQGSMVETLESDLIFDPQKTPSTVGAIPEAFRKRPGVSRSIHPTHSVCAWGLKAKCITEEHERASTNFGPGTPFYKIMEEGGFILGLGVDFGPITFVHAIEDILEEFPLKVYLNKEYTARIIDYDGRLKEMKVRAHDPKVAKTRIDQEEGRWIRNFFTNYLTAKGFLRSGFVGEARCWIIKAKDLFEAQKGLVRQGITVYTTREQYENSAQKVNFK